MKKILFIFLIISFLSNASSFSQSLRQPISAVYLGLGAYSIKHVDVFSFVSNQASLAQIKNPGVGVYGEKRFLLQETSMYEGVIVLPSKLGNWGVNMKYSGFKNFNENQIGLAYARSLGKKVDIGIQFNYYAYRIPAYINDNAFNAEIGAVIHLTKKLNAGIHMYNPMGGKFSKSDEKLTSAYKMGLGYDVSDKFFVSAEVVKEEDFPVNVNAGIQYNFVKQLFARAGISTATSTCFAGFGLGWNKFRLDISGSYHPQLGYLREFYSLQILEKQRKIDGHL